MGEWRDGWVNGGMDGRMDGCCKRSIQGFVKWTTLHQALRLDRTKTRNYLVTSCISLEQHSNAIYW